MSVEEHSLSSAFSFPSHLPLTLHRKCGTHTKSWTSSSLCQFLGRAFQKTTSDSTDSQSTVFSLYTWCGSLQKIVLLDQRNPQSQLNFKTAKLFPPKIPKNLMGCPIKVATSHVIPYVINTENITDWWQHQVHIRRYRNSVPFNYQ